MDNLTIKDGVPALGIFAKDMDAWVSSRHIARVFDKEHYNVIAQIDKILEINDDFNALNFKAVTYKDAKNEKRKEYLLNRKSFALVVMGFTGAKAMQFKKDYIEAFEAMYSIISTRMLSKQGYKEMGSAIRKHIGDNALIYAKEADMINQIVLGMKAKDFRELNHVEDGNTRDAVVESKLAALDRAQRLNAQLITAGIDDRKRESIIKSNFGRF